MLSWALDVFQFLNYPPHIIPIFKLIFPFYLIFILVNGLIHKKKRERERLINKLINGSLDIIEEKEGQLISE